MEEIKEYLSYSPETGVIRWKKSPSKKFKVGDVAGHKKSCPYYKIGFRYKRYLSHRIAWFLFYGVMPVGDIDHKNGNKTDNRIENLREISRSENGQNRIKPQKNCRSGCLGVSWSQEFQKWKAQININNKRIYLGRFDCIDDAKSAYLKAKEKMPPSFTSGVGASMASKSCNEKT